jgi:hypothetical protein
MLENERRALPPQSGFFYHMKTNLSMFRFAVLMPFDILIGRIPFHHLGGIMNLTEHQ